MKTSFLVLIVLLGALFTARADVFEGHYGDDGFLFLDDNPDENRVLLFYSQEQFKGDQDLEDHADKVTGIFVNVGEEGRCKESWVNDLHDKVNMMRLDKDSGNHERIYADFNVDTTPTVVVMKNSKIVLQEVVADHTFDHVKEIFTDEIEAEKQAELDALKKEEDKRKEELDAAKKAEEQARKREEEKLKEEIAAAKRAEEAAKKREEEAKKAEEDAKKREKEAADKKKKEEEKKKQEELKRQEDALEDAKQAALDAQKAAADALKAYADSQKALADYKTQLAKEAADKAPKPQSQYVIRRQPGGYYGGQYGYQPVRSTYGNVANLLGAQSKSTTTQAKPAGTTQAKQTSTTQAKPASTSASQPASRTRVTSNQRSSH